jgi:hypothetical protein
MDEERTDSPDESSEDQASDSQSESISDTTAPSIGPNTVIDRSDEKSPEEVREESPEDPETGLREVDLDAMGHDKRRQVVGKSYGASAAKQAAIYGAFVALVIALAFGAKILIDHADKPPAHNAAQAPWAQPGAPQTPPKPLE